jgi:hypothetical protein
MQSTCHAEASTCSFDMSQGCVPAPYSRVKTADGVEYCNAPKRVCLQVSQTTTVFFQKPFFSARCTQTHDRHDTSFSNYVGPVDFRKRLTIWCCNRITLVDRKSTVAQITLPQGAMSGTCTTRLASMSITRSMRRQPRVVVLAATLVHPIKMRLARLCTAGSSTAAHHKRS